MILPEDILIFDIDGVLTDLEPSNTINPSIIRYIENIVNHNVPVCFNTGRSSQWVKENILPTFSANCQLQKLCFSCEMGNILLHFDSKHNMTEKAFNRTKTPKKLISTITEFVSSNLSQYMFIDLTKKTILTIEKQQNANLEEFKYQKNKLITEIKILLKNYHPNYDLVPSSSTIAIDLLPKKVNKASGVKTILKWLKQNYSLPKSTSFTTFGDSHSDLLMPQYLSSLRYLTKFIYVGKDDIELGQEFTIIKPSHHYSNGTLEYLNSLQDPKIQK